MKNLKTIGLSILYVSIFLLVQIFISIAAGIILILQFYINTKSFPDINQFEKISNSLLDQSIPLMLVNYIVCFLMYFLILLIQKENLIERCSFKRITPIYILFCISLGIFLNPLISIFLEALNRLIDKFFPLSKLFENYNEYMETIFANNNFFFLLLIVGILGPIFEEILFRGLIQNELKKSMPVFLSIFLQGCIFGIIHLQPLQIIYASLLGFLLGFIYHITKSLWAPIIIHIVINSTSTIYSQNNVSKLLENENSMFQYLPFFLLALGLILSIITGILSFVKVTNKSTT